MEKEFKEFLYAGVDLFVAASDEFEKSVTTLILKGKITSEEGKKLVDDFLTKTEKKK